MSQENIQNLWQVVNYDDLLYFLRNGQGKFIVLSIVLIDTNDKIKSMIKKFIKRKSVSFPNVTFLYYPKRKDDTARKLSLLKGNNNEFPKMCHIYNVEELLLEVSTVDCIEILDESFKKLEPYYIRDLKNPKSQNDNSENAQQDHKTEISNASNSQYQTEQHSMPAQSSNHNEIDMIAERRKLVEKIALLKEKAGEYNIEFLKECQKRKKEEEKTSNKK